jgi:hypothetical protein
MATFDIRWYALTWSHNHMHSPPGLVAWRWPPTPTVVVHKQVNLGRLSSWFMPGVGFASPCTVMVFWEREREREMDLTRTTSSLKIKKCDDTKRTYFVLVILAHRHVWSALKRRGTRRRTWHNFGEEPWWRLLSWIHALFFERQTGELERSCTHACKLKPRKCLLDFWTQRERQT